MADSTTFITQMLAPSIMISGTCFLISNTNNHFSALSSRISFLDCEIYDMVEKNKVDDKYLQRIKFMEDQRDELVHRGKLTKYIIFILHIAIIFIVASVLALAAEGFKVALFMQHLPIISFVSGVCIIFIAVLLSLYEIVLALKSFNKDFKHSGKSLQLLDKEILEQCESECKIIPNA